MIDPVDEGCPAEAVEVLRPQLASRPMLVTAGHEVVIFTIASGNGSARYTTPGPSWTSSFRATTTRHHHSGIGLHTAADVHYGHAAAKTVARSQALAQARAAHPERFTNHNDPKILELPEAAWINPPPQPAPAA